MTVLLVLLTFLTFIVIDYLMSRRRLAVEVASTQPARDLEVAFVEGFRVPRELRYHPGHTWVLRERKNLVRVGIDEFAAALMGKITRMELPRPGLWVRQGQKIFSFYRDGEKAEMVSPTEGEVVEVNTEALKEPALLRKDPYGSGWLLLIHAPDDETVSRNLVPRQLVREWMREAVERLYLRQPRLAGAVAADGGRPVEDLFAALPGESWTKLTQEFFLT
ncbi:MAG: glycine cleavage system protein H [Bryobacterales bacterium]|nr:glycine cleavage system protein H [Bryobacteraceae bacterium]MDW8354709.1 glycine cleavage system protein H [Bryobacterales bacterium]